MKEALLACDRLIAPSTFLRDVFVDEGIPADRFELLAPVGPAPQRLARTPKERSRARLVYAGDLRRAKGAGLLLDAIAQLERPIELDILGGPPAPPAPSEPLFQDEINSLAKGQVVRFHGRYARQSMVKNLDEVHAVVVPSLVRESFGRVANEALQLGVPVVVPEGGGLAEQIDPGRTGLLFRRGDASDLARAIDQLLSSSDRFRPASSTGDCPSGWSVPTLASELPKLLAIYGEVL